MFAKSLFPVLIGVSLGKAAARAKDSNLMENEGFRTFAMIIAGGRNDCRRSDDYFPNSGWHPQ